MSSNDQFEPRILVTCGRGNVGRELVPVLSNKGFKVVGGLRSAPKDSDSHFDFSDQESVKKALRVNKINAVFLIIPEQLDQNHVDTTIDTISKEGVKRVVAMAGAVEMEAAMKKANFTESTVIAPNWFMQNYNQIYKRAIKDNFVFSEPAGDVKTPFIDCRDIADVAVELLTASPEKFANEYHGKTFNLTGPESISRQQVAEYFSQALKRKVEYLPLDKEGFIKFMCKEENGAFSEEEARFIANVYDVINSEWATTKTDEVERITKKKGRTFPEFVNHYLSDWQSE